MVTGSLAASHMVTGQALKTAQSIHKEHHMGNKTLKQLKLQESQNFPHASYPADCPPNCTGNNNRPSSRRNQFRSKIWAKSAQCLPRFTKQHKNDDLKWNFFMNKKCLQLLYMFAQKYVDVLLPTDPDALDIWKGGEWRTNTECVSGSDVSFLLLSTNNLSVNASS